MIGTYIVTLIDASMAERNFNIFYSLHVLPKDMKTFQLIFNLEDKHVCLIVLLYPNNINKDAGAVRETYKQVFCSGHWF